MPDKQTLINSNNPDALLKVLVMLSSCSSCLWITCLTWHNSIVAFLLPVSIVKHETATTLNWCDTNINNSLRVRVLSLYSNINQKRYNVTHARRNPTHWLKNPNTCIYIQTGTTGSWISKHKHWTLRITTKYMYTLKTSAAQSKNAASDQVLRWLLTECTFKIWIKW